MSAEQNKQSIKRLFNEGMNQQNFSVVEEVIDDIYVNHGFPDAKPGVEGLKEVIQKFTSSFPDMQITQEEVIAEGEIVATRGKWNGTHTGDFMGMPPTGKQVEVTYADFWKFKNGKAVENWVQMDIVGLMHQLGAMK